ncbi:MAG TPA: DUF5652 family protein [Candidatus Paceibacterota bacterium]
MDTLVTALTSSNELLILSLITLPVKAFALWYASRLGQKWWFAILFISNTFAILDFIYIFLIARKYEVETVEK